LHGKTEGREKRTVEIESGGSPFLLAGFATFVNGGSVVCDQKTSKFLVPNGRIHGRTHGYKGSLLKVREGKYKREHDGAHLESAGRESMLLFSRYF
jgi:hypothetical protein